MTTKHTPIPWELGENRALASENFGCPTIGIREDGLAIAVFPVGDEEALANAVLAVKCVNVHDEIVAAIQYALQDHPYKPYESQETWWKIEERLKKVLAKAKEPE